MTARSYTVYDGDFDALRANGLWDPMRSWLLANGITPGGIPATGEIIIEYSPSGRGWINYLKYRRNDNGTVMAGKDGAPLLVECEAMMTADLPLVMLLGRAG